MTKRSGVHRYGLSLIEVLIALVVLIVGIFAAVQLQAISLRNTSIAEAISRTTRVVRSEIEWQRYTTDLDDVFEIGEAQPCTTPTDGGFTRCDVTVEQCSLVFPSDGGRARLACGGGSGAFFAVTVDAAGPRGQELTLSTLWTGVFISGGAVGGGGDE